jgi:hypothetical protein
VQRREREAVVFCENKVDMPRGEPDFPLDGPIFDHEEWVIVEVDDCLDCSRCGHASEVRSWARNRGRRRR